MLILSRRINEELRITHKGVQIKLVLVGIKGGQVRIGISAPEEVTIDREEVARRKEREL
jgi:carbon storage regulator